jgi:hypothetical protein
MNRPVTLENDALRVQVYPQLGGKVASICDKADNYELLFNFPDEIPEKFFYDATYSDHWFAGWDECFPSVAKSPYVGQPYDGILSPDHGELWGLPTTAVPTTEGITTVWHGLRFGYRLTRKLHLDGPSVLAEYTLVNLAPFPFHFVWAMHCLMSSKSPAEIDLGGPLKMRRSHGTAFENRPGDFDWPTALPETDLSNIAKLPAEQSYKAFSHDPIAASAVVRYPARKRSVRIEFQSEALKAFWGVWINTGGWQHHQHFALEPCTGRYDELDQAIRDGSAGTVEPRETAEWTVRFTVA